MLEIREARDSTGLSQREFAKMFQIPLSTLRKWEQNETNPPRYVVKFIEDALPYNKKEYECYLGKEGQKYYLDKEKQRVGDCLGNWIRYEEDIEGVIESNIGLYIEKLFVEYYQAIKKFNDNLKYDKIDKIKWR